MTAIFPPVERHMVVRSVQVALVVGTALTVVNQGPELVAGSMSLSLGLRIGFTYAVPFAVALYSMLGTTLELRPGQRSRRGGTYVCRGCPGPASVVVTVAPGERLPPCPQCGRNARWVPRHD